MPMTPLSVIDILKFFDDFSKISGRKTNKSKYAGIGDLKGVRVALCRMQCIKLNKETVKSLGILFSYKKKLEEKKTLKIISKDQKCFKSIKNERLNNWRKDYI